jgi:hypothetical protein
VGAQIEEIEVKIDGIRRGDRKHAGVEADIGGSASAGLPDIGGTGKAQWGKLVDPRIKNLGLADQCKVYTAADSKRYFARSADTEISEAIDGRRAVAGDVELDESGALPKCERNVVFVWG